MYLRTFNSVNTLFYRPNRVILTEDVVDHIYAHRFVAVNVGCKTIDTPTGLGGHDKPKHSRNSRAAFIACFGPAPIPIKDNYTPPKLAVKPATNAAQIPVLYIHEHSEYIS
jgi:hypothetical protein